MTTLTSGRRPAAFFLRAVATALLLLAAGPLTRAADTAKKTYDVPAGDAAATLRQFGDQSGAQVVFPVDQVRGVRTNAVKGELTARDALNQLVRGTDLAVTQDQSGALGVNRTAAARAPAPEETVQLSAFEVRSDSDNSYGALESNSLTSFRMDLQKMPATVQVFTRTFMDDIAATSIEEVVGYAGTVTAGTGNPAAMINSSTTDRDGGSSAMSIRGDAPSVMKRDGFTGPRPGARTSTGITDNFSVERAEVIEGPQSILYGSVGGGGVINTVSKRAQFNSSRGSVSERMNQYGSKRVTLDYNYGLKNIAVRVAATAAENRGPRFNLGSDFYGYYTQLAFRLSPTSTLRVQTEKTDNWAIVSFKPSYDNFLPVGDARRGKDARFLALTGQLADLGDSVVPGGVNFYNLESLAGWWNSEHMKDHYSSLKFEQKLPWGFSAEAQAYYDNMIDNRLTGIPSLVPGKGKTGSQANPYDGAAIRLAAPFTDNQQANRDKGVRVVLLHEKEFSFWGLRGRSQSGLSASGFHQYPGFGGGGLSFQYYQADANWNPVINPALTTNYGRIPLATDIYVPLQNGIHPKAVFMPTTPRITVNGVNYVRLQQLVTNPANETPADFKGVVPNSGATGFTGSFNNNSETHSRYFSAVNVTDWFDGKLTTMAGYGFTNFESLNLSLTPPNTFVKFKYLAGWGVGVSYRLLPWLHVYALESKAAQASGSTDDIIGVPLKTPDAKQGLPELGLKATFLDNRVQAQLNWNPETLTRFANQNIGDGSFTDIINPNGINTRFGTGTRLQQRVNLDRTLGSIELVLTANLTQNWRLRFSAAHMDGKIAKDVTYSQLYNDQFFVNGGVVTYGDKTPLLVDPTAKGGAKTSQLTLAMINDPTNPYYAAPSPDSGSITSTTLRNTLLAVDPAKGTAATGVTGLPITAVQYTFTSPYPNGLVTIYREGEKNTGFNEYSFNFQNNYSVSEGSLKGLRLFTNVASYLKNRAYYTIYPGAGNATTAAKQVRQLYRLPTMVTFNYGIGYSHKLWGRFQRYGWSTQLNVNNAFNHDRVWILPTAANGNTLNARQSASPREFIWSNTVTF